MSENNQLAPVDPRAETAEILEGERTHWTALTLAEWFLSVEADCDAKEKLLAEQHEKIKRQIAARRAALHWKFGREFRAQVEADKAQQKGKKKSVTYATGAAGFRTVPAKLTIVDADALKKWCLDNLPEGLKLELSMSKVKEHWKATGEIPPGTDVIDERESFFPAIDTPQLEERSDAAE